MKKIIIYSFIMASILYSCKSSKKMSNNNNVSADIELIQSTQQLIIYKTIRDFNNLVPIIMNNERTKILSYPAPTDLFYNGILAKPTILKNGYLIDNRGITENVAFLNISYEAYSQLKEAPKMAELMNMIAEKYPLAEMYNCGDRTQFSNKTNDINLLIDSNFKNCKKINTTSLQINF